DTRHLRLATQFALGAHLTRHTGDLTGEGVELVHHRVDGFLQLQYLAANIHGDLLKNVAYSNGRGHLGNVALLRRQVIRHRVDVVSQPLPSARDAWDDCLATQFALGAYLARYTRYLRSEGIELIHHRINGFLQLQNLAADIHR